jgi:hypothetical protein
LIEENENSLEDVITEFIYKYWYQLESIVKMVHYDFDLTYEEGKDELFSGIKLNLDQLETDEKWSNYVVGRVYRNRRKNYYEECIYWFLIHVYLVDGSTTKDSLYNLAFKDISELRLLSKSQN